MSRCKSCKSITIATIRKAIKVHDSLLSLQASAEQGCHFCNLCWTCLLQQNAGRPKFESLAKVSNSVWLQTNSSRNMDDLYGERDIIVAILPGQPDCWSGNLGSDVHAHGLLDIFTTQGTLLFKGKMTRLVTIYARFPDRRKLNAIVRTFSDALKIPPSRSALAVDLLL